MIAKAIRGPSFGRLQSYLLGGRNGGATDRVAWTSVRNLPSDDPELAREIMRATAEQSARVEKPVYNVILSLSPDEKLDREAMLGVVERTLRDVGLHEHQALIVAHDDTRHHHVHVMVNRVHPETRVAWRTSHDYARIEKSLREQEREMRLREVPGRHYALPEQERHRGVDLTSGDRRFWSAGPASGRSPSTCVRWCDRICAPRVPGRSSTVGSPTTGSASRSAAGAWRSPMASAGSRPRSSTGARRSSG